MDLRRVRRLAFVLSVSQLRSGRSSSTPRDFLGRPLAVAVADVALFSGLLGLSWVVARSLSALEPALFVTAAKQLIAFLPVLELGVVLAAGVMFELSATGRFGSSDAANWLPITPVEYVLASSLAAAFSYSLVLSLLLGLGLGIALVAGLTGGFLLAAVLSVASLLLGGLLIEMLRASTQRLSSLAIGRGGRATLVLRVVTTLAVILLFVSISNPTILLDVLNAYSRVGPIADFVPLLWSSRSVETFLAGEYLAAGGFLALYLGLVALAVWVAAALRVRFWSVVAPELRLEAFRPATGHRALAVIGLRPAEAALAAKDLRGLVRRRELLPILVLPAVISIFSFVSIGVQSSGDAPRIGLGLLQVWVPGFFGLIVASTSFGQERRAIQTLFSLPVPPYSVFRAKLAVALLPGTIFTFGLWTVGEVIFRWPAFPALVLLAEPLIAVLLGACIGLTFAARWSDFQERPRPQFIRPLPMMGAVGLTFLIVFGLGIPVVEWAGGGAATGGPAVLELALPLFAAAVLVPVFYLLARGGTERFLVELPP